MTPRDIRDSDFSIACTIRMISVIIIRGVNLAGKRAKLAVPEPKLRRYARKILGKKISKPATQGKLGHRSDPLTRHRDTR